MNKQLYNRLTLIKLSRTVSTNSVTLPIFPQIFAWIEGYMAWITQICIRIKYRNANAAEKTWNWWKCHQQSMGTLQFSYFVIRLKYNQHVFSCYNYIYALLSFIIHGNIAVILCILLNLYLPLFQRSSTQLNLQESRWLVLVLCL
jgi:hypothetical protein